MTTKSIVRVTVFVLISLVLIAATTMGVRGLFGDAQAANAVDGAHVFMLDSLRSDVTQSQPAVSSGDLFMQSGKGGHNCESEAVTSPDD